MYTRVSCPIALIVLNCVSAVSVLVPSTKKVWKYIFINMRHSSLRKSYNTIKTNYESYLGNKEYTEGN